MNLTPTKPKGLTLIELTLVLAVLLGLIAVLFIGVAGYKKAKADQERQGIKPAIEQPAEVPAAKQPTP